MSAEPPNLENRTTMALCLLLFIVSAIIAILSYLIFDVFWIMIIPLAFLIVIIISQSFSRLFWNTNKKCPRCRESVSIYSEFCPNCGFKLIISCPECQGIMSFDDPICKTCGYRFNKIYIPDDAEIELAYDEKKNKQIVEQLNFCPHCGVQLEINKQNLRFCDQCGSRINL